MGLRQRQWAAKARLQLRRILGMKCAKCGSKDYRKLEFDLINPSADNFPNPRGHHKIEWSWRMSFYRKQFAAGNLQLLCGGSVGSCHGKKTAREQKKSSYENV
jgi:5-methylcytosine-specific restriction endonuclease McrA